jgi:hypothetical protein
MSEILDLKDHVHFVAHCNDVSILQAKLLVVIEDGVHVLDPYCIHGAV